MCSIKSSGLIIIDEQTISEGCAWYHRVVVFFFLYLYLSKATLFVNSKKISCFSVKKNVLQGAIWWPCLKFLRWVVLNSFKQKSLHRCYALKFFYLFLFFVCNFVYIWHMRNLSVFHKELNETKVACSVLNWLFTCLRASFMCLFCVCMCVHAYLCDLCLDSLNLFLWIPMKNDLKNKSSGQKSIDE